MNNVLPWQSAQWSRLCRHVDKLAHAMLFVGQAGLGKTHFATCLAASLLCQEPKVDFQACGACKSCHLFSAGNHPDVLTVKPEAPNRAIKIDTIRQLVDFSMLSAAKKVIIIQSAENMNRAAANALLKLLEEPPAGVYIILISERPSRLLPTIRSRCQMITFPQSDHALAMRYLHENHVTDNAELLLTLTHHAPLAALALNESNALKQRQHIFQTWQAFMLQASSLTAASKQWHKFEPLDILPYLQSWLMDIIRLIISGNNAINNRDLAQVLERIAPVCHIQALFVCLDQLYQLAAILADNIALNKQLLIENLLLLSWSCLSERKN
ncbi:MAG: DNA polymerase III subunit delta' [Pseudomonadota bacterium]